MTELIGKLTESKYQSSPLNVFQGTFSLPLNDPDFQRGQHLGQESTVSTEIAVHPNNSGRIIINIPGRDGEIDGYSAKYKNLAHHMQQEGLGAVVRIDNRFVEGYLPDVKLRAALAYAKEHALEICGNPNPEFLLMGTSAGASAVSAIAHEYPQVSRILLFAPSGNMPKKMIEEGLAKFNGEVYIVIGENDEVVGVESGEIFLGLAKGASHKELFTVSNCDHRFTGEANGRIMSEAPFYAFSHSSKPKFPNPAGGIKLYS